MTIRVAINGFGRIGRQAFKIASERPDLEIIAINDIGDVRNMAYLLKHDTVYHTDAQSVVAEDHALVVDGERCPVLSYGNPAELPWKDLNVDVVIESTGRFTKREEAEIHLRAGAKRVVVSAPAKGVPAFVMSVNDTSFNADVDTVISNASCTTNSIAPVMAVLDEAFGVEKALMTTVHSYTADQRLVDTFHKDWRRGRAAAQNIVPTSTGAAIAAAEALPQLKGRFDGMSLRVPTIDVSLSDITMLLRRKTTVEEINDTLRKAAKGERYKGILSVTDEPLVSSDFVGNPSSAIVDLALTQVIDGDFVKVLAWYDNEWGYANRLVEEAVLAGNSIKEKSTAGSPVAG